MAAWRMEATEVEVEAEVFLVVEGLEEVEVCHICYLLVNLIEVCTSVFFFLLVAFPRNKVLCELLRFFSHLIGT